MSEPELHVEILARGLAVIGVAGGFVDFLMQSAAEGHVEFLKAAADREQRQFAFDRCADEGQCQRIAVTVDGFGVDWWLIAIMHGLDVR